MSDNKAVSEWMAEAKRLKRVLLKAWIDDERGKVIDDGVACAIADDAFDAHLRTHPSSPGAAQPVVPKCETCKHWKRAEEYETGHAQGLGRCAATPMFWDMTEWRDDQDDRAFKPEAEATTAFAQDGSDYLARIYTRPTHGCTMHATIDSAAPTSGGLDTQGEAGG